MNIAETITHGLLPRAGGEQSVHRLVPVAVFCVAAALSSACSDKQPPSNAVGADTMLNEIIARAPRAQVVEDLRLDADVENFSSISRLYVGPQHQILVPLPQDMQLRIYDEAGTLTASVGRRGSGPGEFQALGVTGSLADTIWVSDVRQRRVTYIAPDGTVLRAVAIPQRELRDTTGGLVGDLLMFSPLAVYSGGFMLGEARARPLSAAGTLTPRVAALMAPDAEARVLFVPPSFEDPRWMLEVEGFGQPVPFSMSPQLSWSANGRRFATLHTDTVTSTGGTLHLKIYEVDNPGAATAQAGTLRPVVERSIVYQGEPIPQQAIDSALAAFIPQAGRPTEGPADLPSRFQDAARARMPTVYPPVARLRLGLDDTIWFDLRPSQDGRVSLVLDEAGMPLATVTVPANVTIAQSSRNRVWALERDEFGLASVVRYRVAGIP